MSKKKGKEPKPDKADGAAPEGEGGEGAPAKKKLPIMLIAIAAGALVVVGGGGAAAYFLFLKPKPAAACEPAAGGDHAAAAPADDHGEPAAHGEEAAPAEGAAAAEACDPELAAAGDHGEEKAAEGGHGAEASADTPPDPTLPSSAPGPDGIIWFKVPVLQANMQGDGGRQAAMSLQLTLEVTDQHGADVLTENYPRLKDMLLSFMRELRYEDLYGSQGTFALRMEVMRRANLLLSSPSKVQAVNIQGMLVT